MKVYAGTGEKAERVRGPADLARFGGGAIVVIRGTPDDRDYGTWATAIGSAAIRGCEVRWLKD